ncbi:MAG: hypothetical protein H7263_10170 [Candidatus Sericytochromatia bacterium]|nr:hypothetical protein [Candidatus Sericytochromatia bacterium]
MSNFLGILHNIKIKNGNEVKVISYKNDSIKTLSYQKYFQDNKDDDQIAQNRENTVHKLLEYKINSKEIAIKMIRNNLSEELVDKCYQPILIN